MRRSTRSIVTTLCATVLAVAAAPPASADVLGQSGHVTGYLRGPSGWEASSSIAADTACVPRFDAEHDSPQFANAVWGGPNTYEMDASVSASVFVQKYDCGSTTILAAFRLISVAASPLVAPQATTWHYEPAEQFARDTRMLRVVHTYYAADTGVAVLRAQAGAWYGRTQRVNGQDRTVYRPAGCLERRWLYTIASYDNTVDAYPIGGKEACPQPPLPPDAMADF